jgi:uncharacterized protein (TIGR03067 family)
VTKAEFEKLQGAWDIVALETDGAAVANGTLRGAQIVVKGDRFAASSMGATYKGKLRLNPRKTPRTLDLLFEEGPEKGNKSLAIYELDGDTWRICLTVTAKERPTAFATQPDSGLALETLKRAVGGAHALREEIARLGGEWSMVSGIVDGQKLPREAVQAGRRTTKGNETTVRFGKEVYLKAAFTLGVSAEPKTIDYILTAGANQGEAQQGIYRLEGDQVTFCFAPPGQPRPTAFASAAGEALTVWKRQK